MKNFNVLAKQFTLLLAFIAPTLFAQDIQWEQLNGPFGGTALSFASNANGDVFAGADQDQRGIFRSTDVGLTFQPKSAGLYLENRAVSWLVPDDTSYIIAGTDSHIGSKVYKSKDNGESWTQIADLGGTSVAKNDSGHIYVGNTAFAQYSVSKDGGYTWVHYPSPAAFTNCIAITDSGHIFIGGNYTGYRSTDSGANWKNLGSAGLPDGINSIAFAPNGTIYAGCSRENTSNSGVYRSTDNGDSWTAVKQGFRVYASHNIVVNDTGEIFVGSWGYGIWKSTDNGDTWTQCNSGLGHFYIKSMHITDNGDIYAGLSGGGIYRSTDNGETWQQVGLTAASVKKIAINPANGYMFASVNGVSRSTDGGQTWETINSGLANLDTRTFAIQEDGTIFCGAGFNYNDPGVIFRSSDNGNSWVRADTGIAWSTHLNAMAVDAYGNIYAGAYDGIYKSINNGSSWYNIGAEGGAKGLALNSAGDLFMAKDAHGVWRLLNNDTSWTHLMDGSGYTIFCGSNDNLYCGNFRSTDNGDTWTRMSIDYFTSSFAENSLGHLFCGTFNYGSGVWRSTDYGDTWSQINTGLPIMDIRSVAVDSDDYLYAGTWGESVFKTTTSTVTTGIEDRNLETSDLSLMQNYPNPYSQFTTISWQQSKQNHVLLCVYDFTGRKSQTLTDTEMPAGKHKVTFDASGLPAGVYFYQLQVNSQKQTKKMVLIK